LFSLIKSDLKFFQKHITIYAVIFLFLTITLFVLQKNMITGRIISRWKPIELLIDGKPADMPLSGTKVRYEAWRLGIQRWLQRPFWGWGPGSSAYLLNQSQIQSIRIGSGKGDVLKDFHNSYVETLVQIGLVGVLFFAASLWLVLKSLWDAYFANWIRLEIFLFTLGALTLFLIATNFNLRTGDHLGRHHLILFGGIAYAYRYHQMMFQPKAFARTVKQN
jgi:O-antigen ligase